VYTGGFKINEIFMPHCVMFQFPWKLSQHSDKTIRELLFSQH